MNFKTIVQDILNTILVFGLVGTGIESKLSPLVSASTLTLIQIVLGGVLMLVYYADVIFGFQQPNIPTPPAPPVTPTPNA